MLDSKTETQMAEGVTYEERLYYDANGKPVRAYVLTVAPGAATIATTVVPDPNGAPLSGQVIHTNILKQVKKAADEGKNVLAGINAGFFDWSPDIVLGLCIKDGEVIHDVNDRPWFGVTTDGKPVVGESFDYKKYQGNLVTGVGGSNVILKNDIAFHISIDHEFGYERHPRTAIGIKPDGSIVLLVVDGRQEEVSNGAALADVADILASFGCSDALNFDGGGSSTFVLKGEDGNYEVKNSPSDGSLRSVADGIIIILP
jgi:exopolysaccharide biosynthesis protein